MKTKLVIFITIALFIISNTYANFHVVGFQGPSHPLNYYKVRLCDVDTVYNSFYDGVVGFSRSEVTYGRSDDGLTDTVYLASGASSIMINHYSEKNQLLYYRDYYPDYPDFQYGKVVYEYDIEGRVISVTQHRITPTETPPDEVVEITTYDYSGIRMTETGYYFDGTNCEYELDSQGRVTRIKWMGYEDKYIKYTDNKEYRIGDVYYSYTDSSCTSFGYTSPGGMVLGMPDRWVKTVHVFNEKGYLKSKITEASINGVDWVLNSKDKIQYVYADGSMSDILNDDPTINNHVEKTDNTKVFGLDDAIMINTESAANVWVYSISGQFIKQQKVLSGSSSIKVSKDFYLVIVGDRSFKVYVR